MILKNILYATGLALLTACASPQDSNNDVKEITAYSGFNAPSPEVNRNELEMQISYENFQAPVVSCTCEDIQCKWDCYNKWGVREENRGVTESTKPIGGKVKKDKLDLCEYCPDDDDCK